MSDWDISAWLAQGNRPKQFQAGESGAFKRNGDPRKSWRDIQSAAVAEAIELKNSPSAIAKRQAIQKSEKYYHGKPCRHCQNTKRLVSNSSCTFCSNLRSKNYYAMKVKK